LDSNLISMCSGLNLLSMKSLITFGPLSLPQVRMSIEQYPCSGQV